MGDLVSLPGGKSDPDDNQDVDALQCQECGAMLWRVKSNGTIECQGCGEEWPMEDWFEGLMITPDDEGEPAK